MSYQDGLSALHLDMPSRIPRTEYSAELHWDLVSKATGLAVSNGSTVQEQQRASKAFKVAWNYDLSWNTCIDASQLGRYYTNMGHASYANDGSDFREASRSVFADEDDVLQFDATASLGLRSRPELVELFNSNYRERCAQDEELVNMTGIYITCVSGLIDLFGWDLLLTAAGVDPAGFGAVTDRYVKWISQYFEALAASEAPVVMVHDDIAWTSGAFLSPDWYRRYVFPNYKKLLTPLKEAGKRILFTSDGEYTTFIDDIAACGVHGFVLEPVTDMRAMAERYGKTHVIIGNADTRVLLMGSRQAIYDEVLRCVDIGRSCPGYFMAVGNHIPPNTPVENALYYNEIYEKLSRR